MFKSYKIVRKIRILSLFLYNFFLRFFLCKKMSESSSEVSSNVGELSSDTSDSDSSLLSTSSSSSSSKKTNNVVNNQIPTPKTSEKSTLHAVQSGDIEKFPTKPITHEKQDAKRINSSNSKGCIHNSDKKTKSDLHVKIDSPSKSEKQQEITPKSNSSSLTSDDLFECVSEGDSDINAFNIGNNSPVPKVKQKQQNEEQNQEQNQKEKINFGNPKGEIPVPDFDSISKKDSTGESDKNNDIQLEFQLPPLSPIDDSYFEKLMATEFSDEVLLAHAKQ